MEKIGGKIYELRKKKGLTQSELARRIGTTQSQVARLEDEKTSNPEVKTLTKIATALGKTLCIAFK